VAIVLTAGAAAASLVMSGETGGANAATEAQSVSSTVQTSVPASPSPVAACPAPRPLPLRHGVFRFTSYPDAWRAAQKTNRPILVFATSPSCLHCTRMIGETYQAAYVKQFVTASFETVVVDRFEQPELAAKLKVRWYPTTLVVAPNNKVVDIIEGYVDPATFARRLQTTLAAQQSAAVQTR
jgi:thiol-disulfide isomerase/thioredoxin